MRKISFLLVLFLLLMGNSTKAQTYYSPGKRLSLSEINEGTNLFIYVMCYVNGNGANYSRFIVNNAGAAGTATGSPVSKFTTDQNYIWKVVDRTEVNSGGVEGIQITLAQASVVTNNFLGLDGFTNVTTAGQAQQLVVTQWNSNPYVSGTEKSGTDVWLEDVNGNIIPQSQIDNGDPVYLVSSLTGKSINTSEGNFQTGKVNGYPVAFYDVNTSIVSNAPISTAWADGTKWYRMKMNRDSWRYLDTSKEYCDANGNLKLTNTATPNGWSSLWAVTGNATDGYSFYNMATGPGKVLGLTGSNAGARVKMYDASNPGDGVTTTFDITWHSDGYWYIKQHGNNTQYINNRDSYVALWNDASALGNSGSAFLLEAVGDISDYASNARSAMLSRIGMWKKVPAIWPGAGTVYDNLNAVTLSETPTNAELVTLAEAQATAADAFVAAVDGQRFTASNRGDNGRFGGMMYLTSSNAKGRVPSTYTLDEVMMFKANSDISVKIYNASLGKYVGTPVGTSSGSTAAVALANAGNFDIFTSPGYNDNVVIFCVNGVASMHLLNSLSISNYSSTSDMASRWLLGTEVSAHDLNGAIQKATAWRDNLNTLIEAQKANLSQAPVSLVKLNAAIATAQNSFNATNATAASRTAATETLNTALINAQRSWISELGATQQFRLRNYGVIKTVTNEATSETTTTNYYLIMAQTKVGGEGNARLAELSAESEDQKFTLTAATGEDAGKYYITSNGKRLVDLSYWDTDMTDGTGTAYTIEEVDLSAGIFRIRTTKGLLGPNDGVTGSSINLTTGKTSYLYTNPSGTRDNLSWVLEFIAPTTANADEAKDALQVEYNRLKAWNDKNSVNLITTINTAPYMSAYHTALETARTLLNSNNVTAYEYNTAKGNLTVAYQGMMDHLLLEADAKQYFALRNNYEKPTNQGGPGFPLYMQVVTKNAGEGIKLQAKATTADDRKAQAFKFTVGENGTFVIGTGEGQQIALTAGSEWNTQTADNGGYYFIIESEDDVVGGFRILTNAEQGFGPNLSTWTGSTEGCNVVGAPLYYNQSNPTTAENLVWVLEAVASPELLEDMKTAGDRLAPMNNLVGDGLGEYHYDTSSGYTKDAVTSFLETATAMYAQTGDYATESNLTNAGIQFMITNLTNAYNACSINQPVVGKLYRFKGNASNKYMCANTATLDADTKMAMDASSDNYGTIFMVCAGDEVDGQTAYKLLSYRTGYYTKNTYNNGALVGAANSILMKSSEGGNLGYYTLKTNYSGGGKYVYDNNTVVDRNSVYKANNCDWTIEEVTSLPIPLSSTYKWGTIYTPVALNNNQGLLEFYTATISGDKLVMTNRGEDIPANTPYLVKYVGTNESNDFSSGCVFVEISNSTATIDESKYALRGGIESGDTPVIDDNTIYTMQKPSDADPLGFYKFTGTTMPGFKAYLPVPNNVTVRGFVFNPGTTTGIDQMTTDEADQTVYDLSGRRVNRAGKGLYIINGKKVYVK
ncbi:MAG: hypothetical protein PUD40_01700 [Bacteroidales bacterium]|nr:hypothetical protein [Bacteroidales bacterium]